MARLLWFVLTATMWMMSSVSAGPRLTGSTEAPPLPAWTRFCDQHPEECRIDLEQPEILILTQELRTLLSSVNRMVNYKLTPVTDSEHWGVVDLWSYPNDGAGDCEDFQLLKRKLLIEAGLPRRALLMAVVADENRQGHAVLIVRTDHGDFILDNKMNEVVEWFETNYAYIKWESAREAQAQWVFLAAESASPLQVSASR